jgi:hypothetical protein
VTDNILTLNAFRTPIENTPDKLDIIMAGHMAAVATQMELMALWLCECGKHDLATSVQEAAATVNRVSRIVGR